MTHALDDPNVIGFSDYAAGFRAGAIKMRELAAQREDETGSVWGIPNGDMIRDLPIPESE
jgi:hypothetical protein